MHATGRGSVGYKFNGDFWAELEDLMPHRAGTGAETTPLIAEGIKDDLLKECGVERVWSPDWERHSNVPLARRVIKPSRGIFWEGFSFRAEGAQPHGTQKLWL